MRGWFVLTGLCFLLNGCAAISPFIQDFNIISVPEEIALSDQLAESIAQEMTLIEGTPDARDVESIGKRLVAEIPQPVFHYEFYIVEDKTPNAFTIPGGKIYVHTGLLAMATRDELAGVLGHEIGHAYERHPAKALSRAYGISFLTNLLLNRDGQAGQFKTMALQIAQGGILNKYGRDDEREADEISYYLLKRAEFLAMDCCPFFQNCSSLKPKLPSLRDS